MEVFHYGEVLSIMDSSTVVFISILAVGFFFLRWVIAPIPNEVPREVQNFREANTSVPNRRTRRPVTENMIEVVQTIAPNLTVGQIRMDLERSGSVEVTIDRFMETGHLPFPPGEEPIRQQEDSHHNTPVSTSKASLIERYGLEAKLDSFTSGEMSDAGSSSGSSAKESRRSILEKRREEMILKARMKLKAQLKSN